MGAFMLENDFLEGALTQDGIAERKMMIDRNTCCC